MKVICGGFLLTFFFFYKVQGATVCYRCADALVFQFPEKISEIKLEKQGDWTNCYSPENVSCIFGCFEARFKARETTGYIRDCANDKVIRQLSWNGTNNLPQRKDAYTSFEGRMCTLQKCNRQYSDENKPAKAVRGFITRHSTPLSLTSVIILAIIPFGILGGRAIYRRFRKDEPRIYEEERHLERLLVASSV